MQKTGIANMPLHSGRAPQWLFKRMVALSRAIVELMIIELGREELLRRLSDPYWFQCLGCVLGFDWHSSGVTTTVTGALKEALRGVEHEFGLFIAGGKAKKALQTPQEIINYANSSGFAPEPLIYASRVSAKVDNVAVQDGFSLYHHVIIFTQQGHWCVIQQGMNETLQTARRYHWLSFTLKSFVEEPHQAVCCDVKTKTLNFTAKESSELRQASVILSQENPEKIIKEIKKINELKLPQRHSVTIHDVKAENLYKILLKTYEKQPKDFESLLETKGVGAKTLRALALTCELLYGTPLSFKDPARFSFAHGGKDRTPYPVDRTLYDRTIEILKKAIEEAKVERTEKLSALRRLAKITQV
ncbi:MAG: DUF763 domain-containing protein [Thermodesulfovibrio sp.]|jgi:hypothetical protein|uniref:DUF763 domain-containing protein n=1 Tax=Thermodesulfovibrio aggregans TaxID=86166 RepID=A0A2J6WN33_9BACT|nr:MAG: DUF763 domain-containing protein [Thermodesulfovibrio aggregans]